MNLKSRLGRRNENFRMLHTEPNFIHVMREKIISWMPHSPRDYVVVCIGTDRSTGDSLGPLTGTLLAEKKIKHLSIYGTLDEPVHATNIHDYLQNIYSNHHNPFVIAIDACLGKHTSIGHLITGTGPIKPGAAFNKPLPEVGDIHLTGVVNVSGFMEYSVLQNTRLSLVMRMASKTADLLEQLDQRLIYQHHSPAVVIQVSNPTIPN
ncbi:spore protease YyaC [Virgibacillus salarius]|uniref:spore protease YyaC n=1 Tax=Virgibacillus salarius TaxID=447199 RepID=UPI0004155BE6|nr:MULTISPECIES: spore protease YyaC [Bacillaceae]WBX81385.1 spore protease YyaC [Virgibacillus salarius]